MAARGVRGYFRGGTFVRAHTRRGVSSSGAEEIAAQELRMAAEELRREEDRKRTPRGGKSGDPRLVAAHTHMMSLLSEATEKAHLMNSGELLDLAEEASDVADSAIDVVIELGERMTQEDDEMSDSIDSAHRNISREVGRRMS